MDLDFLEERFQSFDPTLLQEQIEAFDAQKPQTRFSRSECLANLSFDSELQPKLIQVLKNLIPTILHFSAQHGLELQNPQHQIRFITTATYEKENGVPFPSNVTLPASQLQYHSVSQAYTTLIVLPPALKKNSEVLNTTRTLFSKFIGEIYFHEHLFPLPFYQQAAAQEITRDDIPLFEKWQLLRAWDPKPKVLIKAYQQYAKEQKLNYSKQASLVQNELNRKWTEALEDVSPPAEIVMVIEQAFGEWLQSFESNPDQLQSQLLSMVQQWDAQLRLVLPHEAQAYGVFEKKDQLHYCRSILKKLEDLYAMVAFWMEVVPQVESLDLDLLDGIQEQLELWQVQLPQKQEATPFVIDYLVLGPELQKQKQQWPLTLLKYIPAHLPSKQWEKQIKKFKKHYESALSQKVYEGLVCLNSWIHARRHEEEASFKEGPRYQRIQALQKNFEFRLGMMEDAIATLGTALEFLEQWQGPTKRQPPFPWLNFKKAWNYTISSVLIHLYYQELSKAAQKKGASKKGFDADQYWAAIEQFVLKKMERGVNFYHLVWVWLQIYQKKQPDSLRFLLYMLSHPQPGLPFVVSQILYPPSEPSSIDEDYRSQLTRYCDALIQNYETRIQEDSNSPFSST